MVAENKKRLQISLEKDLLTKTQALCKELGITVSDFIAICLNSVLFSEGKSEREIIADMVSDFIKTSNKFPF